MKPPEWALFIPSIFSNTKAKEEKNNPLRGTLTTFPGSKCWRLFNVQQRDLINKLKPKKHTLPELLMVRKGLGFGLVDLILNS